MGQILNSRLSVFMFFMLFILFGSILLTMQPIFGESEKNSMPYLLITQIVGQSTTNEGSDAYEFVEIYNHATQDIRLKDYELLYRYPDPVDDQVWPIEEDVVVQAGQSFVLWLGKPENEGLTVHDFNQNFGTNLVDGENIIKINASALHNDRHRILVLSTQSGHEIAIAHYNNGSRDVVKNKGIFYKYPEDGSNVMEKISSATEPARPGTVKAEQIPNEPVQLETLTTPTIRHLTETVQRVPDDGVRISVASVNGQMIKRMQLFYAFDDAETYTRVPMHFNVKEQVYEYVIDDLFAVLGKDKVTYYVEAANADEQMVSETVAIDIRREKTPTLNVENDDILHGTVYVKGSSDVSDPDDLTLKIDGEEVNTYPTMSSPAYFVFDGRAMNQGYQNAVTQGNDILLLMNDAPSGTIIVPVTKGLVAGENEVTIRSGDYHQPYFDHDPPKGNINTFILSNFRMLLGDGTVLRDPEYGDSKEEYRVGSAAHNPNYREFFFTITEEQLDAIEYEWDTTQFANGSYTIQLETVGGDIVSKTIFIDNTGPTIETSIQEGHEYKGDFTIDVELADAISEVESYDVLLDGESIEVPYATSSAELIPGEHTLAITATDHIGHQSFETIHFSVVAEHPDQPTNIKPTSGETGVPLDALLKVAVSDPTDDLLAVSFRRGYALDMSERTSIRVFKGDASFAPLSERVLDNEIELTEEEYANLLQQGPLVSSASLGFPYLRIEATLPEQVTDEQIIELTWTGEKLTERELSMWAWHVTENRWDMIAQTKDHGDERITLTGHVEARDYVKDQMITYLIQDQDMVKESTISSTSMNETKPAYQFVWMTDTQFNTESDPQIFKAQLDWVVDNRETNNIQYMLHTGDIVNRTFEPYQWEIADRYFREFEQHNIPYGLLAGNHDVGQGYILNFDYSYFYHYFGAHRYEHHPYYGGSYKNNRGHYDLISAGGNDFIIVHIGWGDEDSNANWVDEDIAWMNEVLEEYSDRIAILAFHKYLHTNGSLEPANGERFFEEVVVPNENVVIVLGGHYTQSRMRVSEIDDGNGKQPRKVYQILSNYQGTNLGGAGYMKLIDFYPEANKVHFWTYSPYLDDTDPEGHLPGTGEFILDVDLTSHEKQVTTDTLAIHIYTEEEIDSVEQVTSGHEAQVIWEGLQPEETHAWYVFVTDAYGGSTRSNLYTFTTDVVHLPLLQRMIDYYIDGDQLRGPLKNQVTNRMRQVDKFYQEGKMKQAEKHLTDVKKHLNNAALQKHISDHAKETLKGLIDQLIEKWHGSSETE